MTWVNLKLVEERIEHRIMVLINSKPDYGSSVNTIYNYFRPQGLQAKILKEDVPGWEHLAENKRMNRVNKVIRRLIKGGRAKLITKDGQEIDPDSANRGLWYSERLVALNALDRIVYSLEREDACQSQET